MIVMEDIRYMDICRDTPSCVYLGALKMTDIEMTEHQNCKA